MRFLGLLLSSMLVIGVSGCGDDSGSGACAGPGCNDGGAGGSGGKGGTGGSGGASGSGGGISLGGSGGSSSGGAGGSPPSPFTVGHVFVAGSRNARVFELDAQLQTVTSWTHPSFGQELPAPGQSLSLGPAGMAFDESGNLVVAGVSELCVFSKPNQLVGCHAKVKPQATENLIFDKLGNIYSTTATGGTNEIHKYDKSYKYVTTFSIPTGELTGITCDPESNLYIASQNAGNSQIYKVDKTSLSVLATIPVPGMLEGLQFVDQDAIYVAAKDYGVRKVKHTPPFSALGSFTDAALLWAVPVTTDDDGNVYTADYENGNGSAPADLFKFDSTGKLLVARKASEIYGPFGIVVAGTKLPCGAYQPPIK